MAAVDRPTFVPKRLVRELEELYPHKVLRPGDDVPEAYAYGGVVNFIAQLRVWAEEQSPEAVLGIGPFDDED